MDSPARGDGLFAKEKRQQKKQRGKKRRLHAGLSDCRGGRGGGEPHHGVSKNALVARRLLQ